MKIEEVNKKIEYWSNIKELLLRPITEDDNLETVIYKKYLEEENLNKVQKYLSERGYKKVSSSTGNQVVYSTEDISTILKDRNAPVNEKLREVIWQLAANNKRKMRV